MENGIRHVAVACQGGGSHTAFTSGVLKKLLTEKQDNYEVVALSGASGGAICALLSWYALLTDGADKAVELLDSFWMENSANSYWDMVLNDLFVESSRLQGSVAIPEISPYLYPSVAQNRLRTMLEDHVDFERLEDLVKPSSPRLLVSAVDVLSGKFKVFRDAEVSVEAILASAAIPSLFRAVRIGDGVYWDGLFSQNPPVREFVADRPVEEKPDEIWIVQINPERREQEPTSVIDIMDRRNELSGNLSLNQEIRFIEKINDLLVRLPKNHYKPIEVRRIEMLRPLDAASKLDRRPSFIQEMMAYGEEQAENFLRELPDQDSNLD